MTNKEYIEEKNKILSLMERVENPVSWIDAERNKGKWLNEAKKEWCTNDELKRYRALDEDYSEFMLYSNLDRRDSGLPVELHLPDRDSKNIYDHPRWIYVENNMGEKTFDAFPLSIDNNPQVMAEGFKIDIDDNSLNEIKKFISTNYHVLNEFADGNINTKELNNRLIRNDGLTISEYRNELNKELVLEYYERLTTDETNLPIDIWVDNQSTYKNSHHGPRIKFPSSPDVVSNTRSWSTLTLEETPRFLNIPVGKTYNKKILNSIYDFAVKYREELLMLSDGKITLDDFKNIISN